MHPAEIEFVDIARRFAAVGAQVADTYEQGQRRLRLDLLLSQDRLCTAQGTEVSLAAIEQLRRLTAAHERAFARFSTEFSAQFAAAIARLPLQLQAEKQAAVVSSLNGQLQAQSEFYRAREQWMNAAEGICRLIDSRRTSCTFSEAGVDFATDADLLRFEELLGLQQRISRLTRSLTVLGLTAG